MWAIDAKGQRPRLVSMNTNNSLQIGMNGFKLIKDGVVPPSITEKEEQQLKRIEKTTAKEKKKADKAEVKALEQSYKAKLKELNSEYKENQKDYNLRQKIQSSTEGNEAIEKYKEIKAIQESKKEAELWKQRAKELKQLQKQKAKDAKRQSKQ